MFSHSTQRIDLSGQYPTFPSDPELFKSLESRSERISCEGDRILFSQGDTPIGLYLIFSGTANAVVHSDHGDAVAVFRADPGAILGLPALASNRPYSLSATARQGSDVRFVATEEFESLANDQPAIYMSLLRLLAAEVRLAREALAWA